MKLRKKEFKKSKIVVLKRVLLMKKIHMTYIKIKSILINLNRMESLYQIHPKILTFKNYLQINSDQKWQKQLN